MYLQDVQHFINVSPLLFSCYKKKVLLWGCSILVAASWGSRDQGQGHHMSPKMDHEECIPSEAHYLVGEPIEQRRCNLCSDKNQLAEERVIKLQVEGGGRSHQATGVLKVE